MNNTIKAVIIITTFMFCHYVMRNFWGENWSQYLLSIGQQSHAVFIPAKYLFLYGPLVLVTALLMRTVDLQEVLGLQTSGFKSYFIAATICCLPMTVGYAFLSIELNLSLTDILTGSIYAGIFEEVIFRAVLFGALFRFCRLGFIPSALVSSVIFGLAHMYQGHDALSALMSVGITTIAGAWFSWLYCECGYRIWFPLWMHIFMNAAYGVFGMSGGAVGDIEGNIFKATAIILSIAYVHLVIRRGKKREVTITSLWLNHSGEKLQSNSTITTTIKGNRYV